MPFEIVIPTLPTEVGSIAGGVGRLNKLARAASVACVGGGGLWGGGEDLFAIRKAERKVPLILSLALSLSLSLSPSLQRSATPLLRHLLTPLPAHVLQHLAFAQRTHSHNHCRSPRGGVSK